MTDEKHNETPSASERRLRRYKRAQARIKKQNREDDAFFRAVFSLAGVGAALAIGLAVWAMNGGAVGDMSGLSEPWLGPLSKMEAFGFAFIAFLGALYFWRVRRR